jgi:hypothetical protein
MADDHDILIGMHLHDDNAAGLEVACSCGDLLFVECSLDGLLSLSEVTDIADRHRS